jgi:hypothetical protein
MIYYFNRNWKFHLHRKWVISKISFNT